MILIYQFVEVNQIGDEDEEDEEEKTQNKDNRNLFDTNTIQKVSNQEIEKPKEEGLWIKAIKTRIICLGIKGEEIIKKLVTNSETFETKTKFSQEKYLRKKRQK